MFIYKIQNNISNHIYLYGFTLALNELLKNDPELSYSLINKTDPASEKTHLTLIDFTNYESISEITQEENKLIEKKDGYKTLVLLKGEQSALAYTLQKHYTCSMLCVDELQFHIGELVESCLKKRRFTSTMTVKMVEKYSQLYRNIHFTAAEKRILSGLHSGKRGTEISYELFRSQKTISSHKRRIMKKLGVKDDLSLKLIMKEIDYVNHNTQI
ncbi:helix-turn-helix domain-containing protein [Enterobacter asburiae]|jgi:DNA-binding NarL/FixJ family response regulator|uniref:helix-turn-helix domain-containing protein n=1 Tax=Enterobacter asburiae TaxID=61645 RepID=UPI0018C1D77E|nr:helix-turn-helix transcriptional regulator [Enterobacter asburiae]MBF9771263.1 helix-turn-helix transcriptional regulator [Enterobacter asburiae]